MRLRSGRRCDAFPWWAEFAVQSRVLPKLERDWERIDVKLPPPRGFIS
jgi:hypothetical protein